LTRANWAGRQQEFGRMNHKMFLPSAVRRCYKAIALNTTGSSRATLKQTF